MNLVDLPIVATDSSMNNANPAFIISYFNYSDELIQTYTTIFD